MRSQQRGLPLALGRGPLAHLRGQGGNRRRERRGRVVLPSLCGDQKEGEQGLEGDSIEKKGK